MCYFHPGFSCTVSQLSQFSACLTIGSVTFKSCLRKCILMYNQGYQCYFYMHSQSGWLSQPKTFWDVQLSELKQRSWANMTFQNLSFWKFALIPEWVFSLKDWSGRNFIFYIFFKTFLGCGAILWSRFSRSRIFITVTFLSASLRCHHPQTIPDGIFFLRK